MKKQTQRIVVAFVTVAVCLAMVSCSGYVRVPKKDYQQIDAGDAEIWKVKTKDGHVYCVTRFSVTDSTLVIEEFDPRCDIPLELSHLADYPPYVIDLTEVSSLKKWVEVSKAETVTLTGVAVIVGVGVALYLLIYFSFGGMG